MESLSSIESHKDTAVERKELLGSIEIAPGQYATMLTGNHTRNAVHNGTAVSTVCVICSVTLQCFPEADYVLCPDCNVVSPLDIGGSSRHLNRRGIINTRSVSQGHHLGLVVGLGFTKRK